jgi:serine/threonine protein kinase
VPQLHQSPFLLRQSLLLLSVARPFSPICQQRNIETNAQLVAQLRHECLISCRELWVDQEGRQLVHISDLLNVSLYDHLRGTRGILWKDVKRWCSQILKGLEYLHAQRIVHRALTCDSIFVDKLGDARIGECEACDLMTPVPTSS